ncbi:hypothetical protein SLE2022_015130 [Rubroshorea leprosula]
MECMEEGYLAKIIKGDGSKDIKVGEIIAITVEDEEDIAKFKDYSPSPSGASDPAQKEREAPIPPKQEAVEKPVSSPEPTISKSSSPPSEDRIFASPLARKLAEDHNVPLSNIKGTGPDGSIVKADIEDYLESKLKSRTYPLMATAPNSSLSPISVAITVSFTITVAGGRHRGSTALIVCSSFGSELLAFLFIPLQLVHQFLSLPATSKLGFRVYLHTKFWSFGKISLLFQISF